MVYRIELSHQIMADALEGIFSTTLSVSIEHWSPIDSVTDISPCQCQILSNIPDPIVGTVTAIITGIWDAVQQASSMCCLALYGTYF
jgi:hypothetical protein